MVLMPLVRCRCGRVSGSLARNQHCSGKGTVYYVISTFAASTLDHSITSAPTLCGQINTEALCSLASSLGNDQNRPADNGIISCRSRGWGWGWKQWRLEAFEKWKDDTLL